MEIKSYLLGKKSGGGSTPTLQNKSVEITKNGTTNVTADTGYDGLSQVEVTTNVSGGGADDYFNRNVLYASYASIQSSIKKVPIIDLNNTRFDYNSFLFQGCKQLETIEGLINTSGLRLCENMFYECNKLKEVPLFDTSNVTTMKYMFYACYRLKTIPLFNTSNVTNMESFMAIGNTIGALENVPVLNTSKVTNMRNMFNGAFPHLTDTSLDNILQMCINATSYTGTKTLKQLGLGNYPSYFPVSRIETLPHYQDFIDAGWTIGY